MELPLNIVFAIPGFSTDPRLVEGQEVRKTIQWCSKKLGSHVLRPGAVVFSIDRAFHRHSSDKENAAALEALLATLTRLDEIWLRKAERRHVVHIPLYESGVYYNRTLVWDTIPALYGRGFGDCKSLTACRVAELRRQGVWCRPVFRHKAQAHSTMFHILIMFANGTWEDPSKALGMSSYQEDPADQSKMHLVHGEPHGFG